MGFIRVDHLEVTLMLRLTRALIFGGIVVAVVMGGCSRPLAPRQALEDTAARTPSVTAGSARLFYPLDLGNHWHFHRVFTLRAEDAESTFPTIVRRSSIDRDLVCIETLEGRDYVIDRFTQIDSTLFGAVTYYQWIRNRQDPTGLYEADVDIGTVPTCAGPIEQTPIAETTVLMDAWRTAATDGGALNRAEAQVSSRLRMIREVLTGGRGGLEAGELTRLRYPLTVGSSWVVREDPRFTSTVEALETLRLPIGSASAYRVRLGSQGLGPRDRVLTWYGRSGILGIFVHVEIFTDLGVLIGEDVITLEDLSIDRGRF